MTVARSTSSRSSGETGIAPARAGRAPAPPPATSFPGASPRAARPRRPVALHAGPMASARYASPLRGGSARRYTTRSAVGPANRIACRTPAGIHTAHVGGASQVRSSERTTASPDRTCTSWCQSWRVLADRPTEIRGGRAHDEERLVGRRATFLRHQLANSAIASPGASVRYRRTHAEQPGVLRHPRRRRRPRPRGSTRPSSVGSSSRGARRASTSSTPARPTTPASRASCTRAASRAPAAG